MRSTASFVIKYVLLALIGVVLLVISMFGVVDAFWAGQGGAILGVSAVRVIQFIRYKKDEEYAQRVKVANGDERNLYLAEKARSWGFSMSILLEFIGVIGFHVAGQPELSTLLGFVICLQLVLYWIFWLWGRKKY